MKIYSKGAFVLALLWLALCGVHAAANLYTALDEEQSEAWEQSAERGRQTARGMFGRWWRGVLWFGAVPLLVSVIWAIARPGSAAPLALLLAGAAYTIAICLIVDNQAKRERR